MQATAPSPLFHVCSDCLLWFKHRNNRPFKHLFSLLLPLYTIYSIYYRAALHTHTFFQLRNPERILAALCCCNRLDTCTIAQAGPVCYIMHIHLRLNLRTRGNHSFRIVCKDIVSPDIGLGERPSFLRAKLRVVV